MNQLKPTFFTSDWHIGHDKALDYDQRPFKDMHHMLESLISRYNATVPVNGICYFVGDMGNKPEGIKRVMARLNGTKVLILGNHDQGINTMYNCGFDVVLLNASIFIGDSIITISHCPLLGIKREDTSQMKDPKENWHGELKDKHRKFSMENRGQFHLHGHIHSRKDKKQSVKILDKQFDIGVTANNYTPVSLSQIESWISKYNKQYHNDTK